MPDDLYNNLLKLVVFLEFILSRTIKFTSLNVLQTLIESYVSELSVLYKPSIMLSGTHELLHFIQITEDFGPVNFINCFVYEELNRKVSSMLHGFDLIGEEFIKLNSTLQYLGMYLKNSTSNNEIVNYAKEYFIIRTSNKKLLTKNIKGLHTYDDINITNIDDGYLNNIRIYFKREINISKVFNSVIFNGIKYSVFQKFRPILEKKYKFTSPMQIPQTIGT